jgi:putative tricarboxylic transport membrane protein
MQSQMLDMLGVAINTIADPYNFMLLIAGTAIGVVMGMLPGLGGTVTLALLIPITFGMDPLVAFMLLVAANGGTSQGGAVTAILLNTPGKAPNAATLLDGYPMARQGRGGEAVGASLAASALGAVAGISVLVISIPIMVQIVLLFGPPEIFWLGVWGLTVIAIVVGDSLRTGLVSAGGPAVRDARRQRGDRRGPLDLRHPHAAGRRPARSRADRTVRRLRDAEPRHPWRDDRPGR